MTTNVFSLGARRVGKSDKATDWSPIDVLRAVLTEWEEHPELIPQTLLVMYVEAQTTPEFRPRYWAAGTKNNLEAIGIMEVMLHRVKGDV